ncbi:uncharacterized protein LOC119836268 [Zerene cesonia]|uniref:uncharacterized protein LOC119836268 n=1 Tax=Zerene cesonia TaxID=33412 RepID=UPI0018E5891A|nr:uncharacterized protein LOC119836268 [Zerene cesonia]
MRPQSCIVRDPLALVLRIMRVLSLAPVTIARERGGYRIRVSKRYAYVGYTFILILNALHAVCVWFEINFNRIHYSEVRTQLPLLSFVALSNILVVTIITLHASLFSLSKMNNLIEQVYYMDKIIPSTEKKEDVKKQKGLIILIFTYKFVIDGINLYHSVFNMRYPDVIVYGLILSRFKYALVRLVQIYIYVIYEEILSKIRTVRQELQDLADLLEFEFEPSSAFTRSANASLRMIGEKLDFLREIFTKMNQCNEYAVFFAYICILSWTIQSAFDFVLYRPQDVPVVIFLDILIVMHITFTMAVMIEPFRGINLEVQTIKLQVARMATTDYVTDSIPAPLDMLYDELSTMDMTFSPLGIFTMRRSLLIKTLGAAVTYLIIVVQFKVT